MGTKAGRLGVVADSGISLTMPSGVIFHHLARCELIARGEVRSVAFLEASVYEQSGTPGN
jgi:hypothetical protein